MPTLLGPGGEVPEPWHMMASLPETPHLVDCDSKQRLGPRGCVLRLPVTEEVCAFQDSVNLHPVLWLPSLLHK